MYNFDCITTATFLFFTMVQVCKIKRHTEEDKRNARMSHNISVSSGCFTKLLTIYYQFFWVLNNYTTPLLLKLISIYKVHTIVDCSVYGGILIKLGRSARFYLTNVMIDRGKRAPSEIISESGLVLKCLEFTELTHLQIMH